jgi:uncharacterized membrane protein YidH (DUF202 family)
MPASPGRPGLQAERTELSWERTAIGFVAIGAIALLRHDGPLAPGRTVVAAATFLIAAVVYGIGRTRARQMSRSSPTAIRLVGIATVALAVILAAMMLLFGETAS